ncbi:hypothetical protein IC787_09045 [Acinetobacter seifertii]|nr:hypothetical protein IC787_09045 [Acinetobacter seifertii]QNX97438.1 hypothetical protein IC770_10630 [Acinetobacter seifertii]
MSVGLLLTPSLVKLCVMARFCKSVSKSELSQFIEIQIMTEALLKLGKMAGQQLLDLLKKFQMNGSQEQ